MFESFEGAYPFEGACPRHLFHSYSLGFFCCWRLAFFYSDAPVQSFFHSITSPNIHLQSTPSSPHIFEFSTTSWTPLCWILLDFKSNVIVFSLRAPWLVLTLTPPCMWCPVARSGFLSTTFNNKALDNRAPQARSVQTSDIPDARQRNVGIFPTPCDAIATCTATILTPTRLVHCVLAQKSLPTLLRVPSC